MFPLCIFNSTSLIKLQSGRDIVNLFMLRLRASYISVTEAFNCVAHKVYHQDKHILES